MEMIAAITGVVGHAGDLLAWVGPSEAGVDLDGFVILVGDVEWIDGELGTASIWLRGSDMSPDRVARILFAWPWFHILTI